MKIVFHDLLFSRTKLDKKACEDFIRSGFISLHNLGFLLNTIFLFNFESTIHELKEFNQIIKIKYENTLCYDCKICLVWKNQIKLESLFWPKLIIEKDFLAYLFAKWQNAISAIFPPQLLMCQSASIFPMRDNQSIKRLTLTMDFAICEHKCVSKPYA